MPCTYTSNSSICWWLVQIQAYLQNQTTMLSFIYLILTQKNIWNIYISEQSAFCNIFPESEKKIPWLILFFFWAPDQRFYFCSQLINKRITFKFWNVSVEGSRFSLVLISLDFSVQDSLWLLWNVKSIPCDL